MDREVAPSRTVLALRNAPSVLTHAGYSLLSDYTSAITTVATVPAVATVVVVHEAQDERALQYDCCGNCAKYNCYSSKERNRR